MGDIETLTAENPDWTQLRHGSLIVRLIENEDRAPRSLIDECARRGEETTEFLDLLVHDESFWNDEVSTGEWWLLLHAVMILGLIPSERAGLLLVEYMRQMSRAGDHDLQDWFAGRWPALFRNKPPCVLPAARAMCEDRDLDWYIRANAVDVIVAGARQQGDAAFEQALDWLAVIAADESEDWELRMSCGDSLLDFPRARHRPLLDELAAQQEVGLGAHFRSDDIEQAYVEARDEGEWERFGNPWEFYDPAAIEHRQQRWLEEDARADGEADEDPFYEPEPPFVRAVPKPGRNDPCPCGSGKKYKKCCLEKETVAGREGEGQSAVAWEEPAGTKVSGVLQIKVTLQHIVPPVWRRMEVPADFRLPRLHHALQVVMGWEDYHLHAFRIGRAVYGEPDLEFADGTKDENHVRLGQLGTEGARLMYEYDFGDSWIHEIEIEKVFPREPGVRYPRCTGGARACPPEDCGGPWGYQRVLEVLADPKNEEYEEMLEWLGGEFDSEGFDLDDVNEGLREV
jgi:hypothetical protein